MLEPGDGVPEGVRDNAESASSGLLSKLEGKNKHANQK